MEKDNKSIHKGHRQRLKNKVRNHGLSSLDEHEILELLLTYTIPQKDTNELAHNLINAFGNISSVIDADYKTLQNIKGVGEETSLYFKILSSFIDYYRVQKSKNNTTILDNTNACVDYFRKNFVIKNSEVMYVVCLTKMGKVIKQFSFTGYDDTGVEFDVKDFVSQLSNKNISAVVVYHTHPNGDALPSEEDFIATQALLNACRILNITLADHLIMNETAHYSFGSHGHLQEMNQKYTEIFDFADKGTTARQTRYFKYVGDSYNKKGK